MPDTRTPIDPQGRHGLEHLLGINGIHNNPDQVNLDTVNPVVDMSMMGHARIHDPDNLLFNLQTVQAVAPVANFVGWVVSYGNHQAALNGDLVYRIGTSLRIIALSYSIRIEDVAGVLNQRTYRVSLSLVNGVLQVPFWRSWHEILAQEFAVGPVTANTYYFNHQGDWSTHYEASAAHPLETTQYAMGSSNQIRCPIIPAGWGVKIEIYPNCKNFPDLTYFEFPALSTWSVRILAQQVPHGAPIPSYWE